MSERGHAVVGRGQCNDVVVPFGNLGKLCGHPHSKHGEPLESGWSVGASGGEEVRSVVASASGSAEAKN